MRSTIYSVLVTSLFIPMLLGLCSIVAVTPAHAATITVTNLDDSNAGSLRQAIADASSGDSIDFAVSGTIGLSSELSIDKDLTIQGGNSITVSGNDTTRVFRVESGSNVSLDGLSIENGRADTNGGGISNAGTLTVTNSTISGNSAGGDGGGIFSQISHSGELTVVNSTISGNSADAGHGGGIYSWTTGCAIDATPRIIIRNSTISNNTADSEGGGVRIQNGVAEITHSTITANSASDGDGLWSWNDNNTCTSVGQSIIAGNGNDDVAAVGPGRYNSLDHNLIGTAGNNVNFNLEFNADGDLTNETQPVLGDLADNGGATQTHALLPGSPAINAGPTNCPDQDQDQRGIDRPQLGTCDIGAFESRGFTLASGSGDNQSATVETNFSDDLEVSVGSEFGEPVDGGQVSFIAPDSGASLADEISTATISGGQASITATANAIVGDYVVTAGASGSSDTATFNLSNLPFIVTASVVDGEGTISPATQNVVFDDTAEFTVTPEAGWSVDEVIGDTCAPDQVSGDGWEATNIQNDCVVEASFVINTYAVTATVGTGEGTITPTGQNTDHGSDASFTVSPDTGWTVAAVTGDTCSPVNTGGTTWVAENITQACAVTAAFSEITFEVIAVVTGGLGSIDPPTQTVVFDQAAGFTVAPESGWSVDEVVGDTCVPVQIGGNGWEASGIQTDCAVEASFVINTYNVTAVVDTGQGEITPSTQDVDHGSDANFTVTPDPGWSLDSVSGDTCSPALVSGEQWVAGNITDACAVTVEFSEITFEVTTGVTGGDGTIDPPTQTVVFDQVADFTVAPESGWSVEDVTGDTCTPVLVDGSDWEATNIQDDCQVEASFVINTYTVTANEGSGEGTITPASQDVDHGTDASFTVTPDTGWSVAAVTGDTCSPVNTGDTTWVAESITDACDVTVDFDEDTFEVTAAVAAGEGTITPPTQTTVFDQTAGFTVNPETGWSVEDVTGDTCTPVPVDGSNWEATNIQDDCAVEASFVLNTYEVSASVGTGQGEITPAAQNVDHDSDANFTVSPEPGWSVDAVSGDTCSPALDSGDEWVAENITDACTVIADFNEETYTIGGTVSDLDGSDLVLQNNGSDDLAINTNGNFTFTTTLTFGNTYEVTVLTQPTSPSQTCTVSNGSGEIEGTDIDDIEVSCITDTFTIGGTLSGLSPDRTLTLQNNGGDDLALSDNGDFVFATALEDLSDYSVSVLDQPDGQSCSVSNVSGTLAGDHVDDVTVDCDNIELGLDDVHFTNITSGQPAEQTLVLTNSSPAELVIEEFIVPDEPFGFDPLDCAPLPRTLAPGESCTVVLSFVSSASGEFEDELWVVSNGIGSPDRVGLSGTVISAIPVPTLGLPAVLLLLLGMFLLALRYKRTPMTSAIAESRRNLQPRL